MSAKLLYIITKKVLYKTQNLLLQQKGLQKESTTKYWNNFRHIGNFARHTMNLIRHIRHLLILCTVHLIIRHSGHFNLALQPF